MTQDQKLLQSAKHLLRHVAESLNAGISVKLWDGSIVPLGANADPNIYVSIRGPGVIGTLLRRPTLETVFRQYAQGKIDFHGADFITFAEKARVKNSRRQARKISKMAIARHLFPFLFARADRVDGDHGFQGDDGGHSRVQSDNKDFIQFH